MVSSSVCSSRIVERAAPDRQPRRERMSTLGALYCLRYLTGQARTRDWPLPDHQERLSTGEPSRSRCWWDRRQPLSTPLSADLNSLPLLPTWAPVIGAQWLRVERRLERCDGSTERDGIEGSLARGQRHCLHQACSVYEAVGRQADARAHPDRNPLDAELPQHLATLHGMSLIQERTRSPSRPRGSASGCYPLTPCRERSGLPARERGRRYPASR